ncbi:MAG TPA: D-alanine--D-alanine ligase family protein [Candidatus Binataceae bacterium]|nr:D-alanine--D-alanine ligase family protein [Candidatus Binataceae bacterium]
MARTKKLRIGVLFGGRSGEHEISLRSALTVMSAMDPRRYEIVPIGIGRDGRWSLQSDALRMLAEATPKLGALGRGGLPVSLLPYPDSRALVSTPSRKGHGDNGHGGPPLPGPLDVVFPVLHGTFGEDGTVQGLLDLAGIPYVGAGVLGSAIGIDKDAQKRLLASAGIAVVRYFALTASDYQRKPALARRYANALGYPVFVKPNALGSSIGITRVVNVRKLGPALDDAFQYDRKVLIEAACEGRELECAVLGNDAPAASILGEIVVKHGHSFYSYDSKYVDPDGADTRIPAELPAAVTRRVREMSVAAFKALSLRGMARVDFLARHDFSEIFVNEVNTIPGFTSISMYPKLWEATGVPLAQLIDRLIELAIEDHRERSALKFTYQPVPERN